MQQHYDDVISKTTNSRLRNNHVIRKSALSICKIMVTNFVGNVATAKFIVVGYRVGFRTGHAGQ